LGWQLLDASVSAAPFAFWLQRLRNRSLVDLLGADQDVVPSRVLVAFDNVALVDLLEALLGDDALQVADWRAGRRVYLTERDG
jgi:hypothetical protein